MAAIAAEHSRILKTREQKNPSNRKSSSPAGDDDSLLIENNPTLLALNHQCNLPLFI